jgi:dTDP-4-dehydrorhamnose reductase
LKLDKQKIFITGSHGMLGSNIIKYFKKKKYEFIGTHRSKNKTNYKKNEFYLDLTKKNKVKFFIKKFNPKIVIHTAGLVNLSLCQKNPNLSKIHNISTLQNLISNLSKDIYFIFISSDQVYGKNKKAVETAKNLKPLNTYGKHKLFCEKLVKNYFNKYIIIRTNIIGLNFNNNNNGFIHWILGHLKSKTVVTTFKNYFFHPINAYFLGRIIIKLVNSDFIGTINIGSKNKISKHLFIKKFYQIFKIKNLRIKSILGPNKFFKIRNEVLNLNIEKMLKLGLKPPPIDKSIKLLKKHLNENKSL